MPIDVECSKCSHGWSVPTAKAGRSIFCPECDDSVVVPRPKIEVAEADKPERVRPGHRPKTDHRSKDRTILIGACLLLLGVLAVVGLRIKAVMSDPNLEFDASPVTDLTNGLSNSSAETATDSELDKEMTGAAPLVTEDTEPSDAVAEVAHPESEEIPATEVVANDTRRLRLAKMETVAVRLGNFSADVRGSVSNIVETAVTGAMQRCKLKCEAAAEPVMQIALELKPNGKVKELWMTAELMDAGARAPMMLWERSNSLGEITDQAFSSGILPPGLERNASTFFNDLRAEFVSARREFLN